MSERLIKFRGVDIDSGEYVYGYYDNDGVYDYIVDMETHVRYDVISTSVAQLIGHDALNREVYEGDLLQTDRGEEISMAYYRESSVARGGLLLERDPRVKYEPLEELTRVRKALRISEWELANRCGVDFNALSDMLKGYEKPKAEVLKQVIEIMKAKVEEVGNKNSGGSRPDAI